MNNNSFNNQEIKLIIEALEIRDKDNVINFDLNNSHSKINKANFNHFVKPIKNLILNFQQSKIFEINTKEKHCIISVINENLCKIKSDFIVDFYNPIYWLNIDLIQKNQLERIDRHKDILDKCGYFKNNNHFEIESNKFRYSMIFEVLDKLKKSDTIFLSSEQNIYKICFVYNNKEVAKFELKHRIFLNQNPFYFLKETIEELENSFSIRTDKLKARNILSNQNVNDYPNGVIEFMIKILELNN